MILLSAILWSESKAQQAGDPAQSVIVTPAPLKEVIVTPATPIEVTPATPKAIGLAIDIPAMTWDVDEAPLAAPEPEKVVLEAQQTATLSGEATQSEDPAPAEAGKPASQASAGRPLLNSRPTIAPLRVKSQDLTGGDPASGLYTTAFMTVGRDGKATIAYTIRNTSSTAMVTDPSQVRLRLNGKEITGQLSRTNTSQQAGYLAPSTMETGIIEISGLESGELRFEWPVNVAGLTGQQMITHLWTLQVQQLNLPAGGNQ